ncbi:MAG TPA: class F sortase, partial [Candidatus Paceibacterota bacterium]|nr:class F sortase [Candidatus Paceibacterota bacterium]
LPFPVLISVFNVDAQTSSPATSSSNVEAQVQTPPQTQKLEGSPVPSSPVATVSSSDPRLVIPAINLNDPIVNVGVTSSGDMAVPDGKTSQVGLYDGGPQPGDVGAAVLDAHVFAAFSKLNDLSVGDDIYVQKDGQQLHFVVTAVKTFALSEITSADLFTPTSDRDLNLITCAGNLTPDSSTYDHRLVVYATLAS